ncbi:hypothetical protein CMEL01_06739 [Colletotrichum melonis]|uniref:Uncharacterized protein n=1 Tax=Colletotrichum melonis TaxID=1209925 RepID=A0AAI9U5N6_9PEZI|nr:hypothetical protein CMEL01_06739 [Colletotrichum melonis]
MKKQVFSKAHDVIAPGNGATVHERKGGGLEEDGRRNPRGTRWESLEEVRDGSGGWHSCTAPAAASRYRTDSLK